MTSKTDQQNDNGRIGPLEAFLALFKIRNEPFDRIVTRPLGLIRYLFVPRAISSRLECKEF
jgi:hypothetical protein